MDDHQLVRNGFRRLIEECQGFEVAGEASSVEEAWTLLARIRYELVVLDLNLPEHHGRGGNEEQGLALLRRLRELRPDLPVLVLTMRDDDESVLQAVAAGARGYLLKSSSVEELHRAIRQVMDGGSYLHPEIVTAVLGQVRAPRSLDGGDVDLTVREREVLQAMIEEPGLREVAARLSVSVNTAKTHVRALYRKFKVKNRTQLVLAAMQSRHLRG